MKGFYVALVVSVISLNCAHAQKESGYVEGSFASAFAQMNLTEIRPSHLLNVETASTLNKNQGMLSAFGDNTRIAYGLSDDLEARADIYHQNDSKDGLGYRHRVTAKYKFLDKGDIAVAIKGTTARSRVGNNSSAESEYTAELPITLKSKWFLLTVNPFYQDPAKGNGKSTTGVDIGTAVPLHKMVDAIVEYKTRKNSGGAESELRGTVAGIAFKPSSKVTIPIVFANRSPGGSTKSGLVNIFAHVGVQF